MRIRLYFLACKSNFSTKSYVIQLICRFFVLCQDYSLLKEDLAKGLRHIEKGFFHNNKYFIVIS